MTHGFDDQGRKYDSEGNMRDWWVGNDGIEYENRAAVMIKQAEQFEIYGVHLKGKLTQGENIADLGGLKLALRALKKHLQVNGILFMIIFIIIVIFITNTIIIIMIIIIIIVIIFDVIIIDVIIFSCHTVPQERFTASMRIIFIERIISMNISPWKVLICT